MLHIRLLGGFQAEQPSAGRVVSGWQRRSAKTLTKLLAVCPRHVLHREEILEILWPGTDPESALNSFGKALHAARHAFQPDLPPRRHSAYLKLTETMLALDTGRVEIDIDRFERLARRALDSRDLADYEAALAAYRGELLPEDRYADWCAERRGALAELQIRLLLGIAEVLEKRDAYHAAAERLRAVLTQDPVRETVHQWLMRLYAEMGTPDQAVRQFQQCQDVLRRELDLAPQPETVALYQHIAGKRVLQPGSGAIQAAQSAASCDGSPAAAPTQRIQQPASRRPFVGRERVLQHLCAQLARGTRKQASMVLVTGEPGVGKTRLLEEFALRAGAQGAAVLWSGRGAHAKEFACGLFAVALEGYAAGLPESERTKLARRYPALTRFVPSLRQDDKSPLGAVGTGDYYLDLVPAIVRLMTDLGRRQQVLLVLGDLGDADRRSLDLVRYLAHLAVQQPWLLVGAMRDEETAANEEIRRLIEATMRERLCLRIGLGCLTRRDCDALVRALLPDASIGEGFLEQLYLASRGNPLFAEDLAHEAQEQGDTGPPLVGWNGSSGSQVPVRLRSWTALRLAAMDQTLRQVVCLAAAPGATGISLGELRAGAAALDPPIPQAALFAALDRALQMRILEESDEGFTFRHPVLQSAVCEVLSRHRREQLQAALSVCRWR